MPIKKVYLHKINNNEIRRLSYQQKNQAEP
jgi:hypothetical protein